MSERQIARPSRWRLWIGDGFGCSRHAVKTLQLFSTHFVGIAKRYSYTYRVRPLPLNRRTRPATTPSVAELNQQNVCTAEDANSTLSGGCEPSGGSGQFNSQRELRPTSAHSYLCKSVKSLNLTRIFNGAIHSFGYCSLFGPLALQAMQSAQKVHILA